MPAVSGLQGAVNGQNTVSRWSVSKEGDAKPYAASNTKGGIARVAGNKDWTGDFDQYGHTPGVFPGAAITFNGYGPEGISGPAVVESISVDCDIEGGEIIKSKVTFGGNGAYSEHSTPVTDATTPNPPSSIGCKLQTDADDDGTYVDQTDVRTWSLEVTCDLKAYNSSDTAGQTKRLAGNIDASGAWTVYCDDISDLPDEGDVIPIRLFVNATQYWDIEFAHIDSVKPDTDIESGDLIGAEISWSFAGYHSGTEGTITAPGAGSAAWPV